MSSVVRMRSQRVWLCLATMIAVVSGCTHTLEVSPRPVELPQSEPLNLSVEVWMSDQFRKAQWIKELRGGETWKVPLGSPLIENTERLAKVAFAKVVISGGQKPAANGGVQAILIPKLVSISREAGLQTDHERATAVRVEWALNDRNGKLIWVDTILGIGKGPQDVYGKDGTEQQVQSALDNLFRQSLEALISSIEVKSFIQRIKQSGS